MTENVKKFKFKLMKTFNSFNELAEHNGYTPISRMSLFNHAEVVNPDGSVVPQRPYPPGGLDVPDHLRHDAKMTERTERAYRQKKNELSQKLTHTEEQLKRISSIDTSGRIGECCPKHQQYTHLLHAGTTHKHRGGLCTADER